MENKLHEDMGAVKACLDELKTDIVALKREVAILTAQANRWKGAFVVLLSVGGVFGWALDRIVSAFHPS